MTPTENPFNPADPLRHHLWERHIRADIDAFIAGDWGAVAGDFDEAAFQAIDAGFSPDPADWTIGFPTLAAYRDRWLEMSAQTRATADPDRLRDAMFAGVRLARIDVYDGDMAILHKVFDGVTPLKDGQEDPYAWQSVFTLRLREGAWKITSFVGYMA
ncbi:hypothetical protein [Pseudooceanicola nitratireducens]|uniref:hypothetical protein n=1 Tax=Pseudooceanicola nitratireducens TaxID=517719 RepID=UPI0035112032